MGSHEVRVHDRRPLRRPQIFFLPAASRTLALRAARWCVLFSLLLLCGMPAGCAGDAPGSASGAADLPATGEAPAALGGTCVTVRRGQAGDVADAFLSGDSPGWAAGGEASMYTGLSGGGNENRGLVRFDLSLLPPGATVTSATGLLHVGWTATDALIEVHRVLSPWDEATVRESTFGQAGNFDPAVAGTFSAGSGGPKTVDLTALAAGWVDGTLPNHGIVLTEALVAGHLIWTSEAGTIANRPGLLICYETCEPDCGPNLCEGVTCAAEDACHNAGVCDPATGLCTSPPAANGTPCDDGDACTQTDICQAGTCTGTNPVACAASDACHVAGACDPATGLCSDPPAADGTPCNDGNVCTTNDACQAGACAGAGPATCDCVEIRRGTLGDLHDAWLSGDFPAWATGSEPGLSTGLSGGGNLHRSLLAADLADTLPPGSIVTAATLSLVASYNESFTNVAVHRVTQPWSETTASGASFGPDGIDPVPAATFPAGGAGLKQVDLTPLVAGWYDGSIPNHGVLLQEPAPGAHLFWSSEAGAANRPSLTVCYSDACAGVVCAAPDECHLPGACDPATGICTDPAVADGTPCYDGDGCTLTDTCQSGVCTGSNPVECMTPDPCHVQDACNPATGACPDPTLAPDGTACDDSNPCTQTDTCQAGACAGSNPVVCGTLSDCHLPGACDPATGICHPQVAPDGTACDLGDACGPASTCQSGACAATGAPVSCDDGDACTADSCNAAAGCVYTPVGLLLASVAPESGTTGVPLTLTGCGFGLLPGQVLVGGVEATVEDWSGDTIVVTLPSGFDPGTFPVEVLPAAGGGVTGSYTIVPWIHGVSTQHAAPGQAVTVVGDGFGSAPGTIRVGGVPASVTSWAQTAIELSIPAGVAGGYRPIVVDAGPATSNTAGFFVRGSGHWVRDSIPTERTAHSAVWTGTEMLTWGGAGFDRSGQRYHPGTDTWLSMSEFGGPVATIGFSTVWTGSHLVVWGGRFPYQSCCQGSGSRYNPVTDTWNPMAVTVAPSPRMFHTAVWTGTEMIVWGGQGPSGVHASGARYNPATNVWAPMATAGAPAARASHAAVWTGTEMIVWGGIDSGSQLLSTGGRYNPATNTWTALGGTPPVARRDHTAVWTGTEMVVWGGQTVAGYTATGARYDPATDTWTPVGTPGTPVGAFGHAAVWTGRQMFIWGGTVIGQGETDHGALYDPATDTWQSTSDTAAPAARRQATLVWTGVEAIAWAGDRQNTRLATGGRYRPGSDAWSPIGDPGVPEGRSEGTALWTGSELLIWGGMNSEGATMDSGARFDPATGTWSPIATAGAPSPRFRHASVWTGAELLVWGGADSGPALGDGFRYDPANDTWAPLPAASAPSARYGQVAVWTGTEMIVWGGVGGWYENTGARYNPATGAWTPTSLTNAPLPRSEATAVWTGTEMIVWGGNGAAGPLGTGGRYNPATDTWSATSASGAPAARWWHSAVWTGSRMIVWGGYNLSTELLNTGASYDPTTDTWTATSTLGAPAARVVHGAIWTGARMMIFGGSTAGFGFVTQGGLYDPVEDKWTSLGSLYPPRPLGWPGIVWTGSEALLFGGVGDGGRESFGGRYLP